MPVLSINFTTNMVNKPPRLVPRILLNQSRIVLPNPRSGAESDLRNEIISLFDPKWTEPLVQYVCVNLVCKFVNDLDEQLGATSSVFSPIMWSENVD